LPTGDALPAVGKWRRCRQINTDLIAGPARDGIGVLLGLGWAAIAALRFLLRDRILLDGVAGFAGLSMLVPHVLIALPFLFAGGAYAVWVPPVVVIAVVLGRLAFHRLRDADPGDSGYAVRGPVLAVLVTATVLVEFGALLAVRLVVVPDPRTSFWHAVTADSWSDAWSALIEPLAGIIVVVVLIAAVGRRLAGWARRVNSTALVLVAVAVPFVLPLPFGGGGVALTAGPVATPEYGKLVLCAALAWAVARDSYRFQGGPLSEGLEGVRDATSPGRMIKTLYVNYRFLLLPLAVFAVVAVASGARHDFGTIVPAALATMGVTWCATRYNLDRNRVGGEKADRRGHLVALYRLFVGAAVLLIAGSVALFTTDYVGERGRVWNDPWRFHWDAPCAVVDAPAPIDATVPAGRVACLRSLSADAESEKSQVARAIAATADGGLWGRGLHDRAAAAVQARATDFVLAVIWNKLGGLVVIGAGLLLALLSAALVRAATLDPAATRPSVPLLFAAGLGTMLTGQFLFVLAATANVVPHTGIPAPLLSRGGQSTLAIGIGIALVLAVSRAHPGPVAAPRVRVVTATGYTALLAGIVAVLTLVPYAAPRLADPDLPTIYAQDRKLCASRTADLAGLAAPPPDPASCSTDLIALTRTRVAVAFDGGGKLVLDRQSGEWTPDDLGGLDAGDLGGLLTPSGVLRTSFPAVMEVSAGVDLRDRLLPARSHRVDSELGLTLDPVAQHRLAVALRSAAPAAVVVLDAATGRILVSASAEPAPAPVAEVDPRVERAFVGRHQGYGPRDVDGNVDDAVEMPQCPRRSRDGAGQDRCWKWSYTEPGAVAAADGALGRRYPYGDAVAPLTDAVADGGDFADQASRVGMRIGGCEGVDRWTAQPLKGSVSSCVPVPAEPGRSRGTPLTLAVLAAAVANGGQAVHPRIVDRVTYPATGVTVDSPATPPSVAFPAETARRLAASRYPESGGLHVLTADADSYRWICGFTADSRTAFAAVVETPAQAGAVLDAIRTTIGDR
jgi:cell division protein FtsW (lipid II flippase)